MKYLSTAVIMGLSVSAVQAHECTDADPAFVAELEATLTGSNDPRVAALAGYLNDHFYTDLACRLGRGGTRDVPDDPAVLLSEALSFTTPRNQSDALLMILSTMQSTLEEKVE